MTQSKLAQLNLVRLNKGFPGMTPERGAACAQAALFCLSSNNHDSGVTISVEGDKSIRFILYWEQAIDDQVRNTWHDDQEATEWGAYGLAALLISELTPYEIVRRSKKRTGVDYWLVRQDAELPFEDAARLEISGILKGDVADIRRRVKKKKKQTNQSDATGLPAFVAIVEFSEPYSFVGKK